MPIFGEPTVPKHIERLKAKVRERDDASGVKLERYYTAYDARLSAAEDKFRGELDQHALAHEAALQELSNRGEGVTAAVSDASETQEVKREPAVEPFRRAAE